MDIELSVPAWTTVKGVDPGASSRVSQTVGNEQTPSFQDSCAVPGLGGQGVPLRRGCVGGEAKGEDAAR